MSERQLQFRVGLFVLLAFAVGAGLIIQFSDIKQMWQETYPIAIHFDEVPGLQPGSPVHQNGLRIGKVNEILLDDEQGGVLVVVQIHGDHKLRVDSKPRVSRSLFGDSKIQFTAGRAERTIPPNARLKGEAPTDPMQAVERLEQTVNTALVSFDATAKEWQLVARNINELVETNRGNLNDVVDRTAVALDNFSQAMDTATKTFSQAGNTLNIATTTLANANAVIADPQVQADIRRTAAALPKIVEETQLTITAARTSLQQVSQNLETIQAATFPIAEQSDVIVRKLSGSLIQLEALLTELNQFSQALNAKDGSLQKFASDPELYRNLNRSAASLSVLLENLSPVMRDVRVFSDKIARHPEILGVSGAMRGSSGIKDPSEVQQTGFSTPAPQR